MDLYSYGRGNRPFVLVGKDKMTKIPWTDETWNMIGGCSPVSEGCLNCAAAMSAQLCVNRGNKKYEGLVKNGKWTGEVRLFPDLLDKPLHWRKPRMIFPAFMGDLFHEAVPFEFIDKVFETMALCWGNAAYRKNTYPNHIFQILTKRPKQMLKYLSGDVKKRWGDGAPCIGTLPNVWLGVSVENQKAADERIPILLQIPAAVQFVSVEPMLEAVDLKWNLTYPSQRCSSYIRNESPPKSLDWVIIGCESGPKRRPCKLEWVRDLVEQCKAADVPVFVKQLSINGKVSHKPEEWPEWARLRQMPKGEQ